MKQYHTLGGVFKKRVKLWETENFKGEIPLQELPRLNTATVVGQDEVTCTLAEVNNPIQTIPT